MKKYIATFPAGTFLIIAKYLKSFSLNNFKIIDNDESSVMFLSDLNAERLIEIRFFTNVFVVIEDKAEIKKLVKGNHFRLIYIKNGEPTAIESSAKLKLEQQIIKDYSLQPNARLSRNDFYVIKRKDRPELFTLRLPRAKFKREELLKGELRPELANILCLAAGVKAKQTVVDMFAGTGAILYEAVRGFGVKHAVAIDSNHVSNRHELAQIKWHKANSTDKIDFIKPGSVDRIVTDPPWGEYDKVADLSGLYKGFLLEAARILRPGGVIVILSGYINLAACLATTPELKLIGRWDVLVSGKKSTVYKVQKISRSAHNIDKK